MGAQSAQPLQGCQPFPDYRPIAFHLRGQEVLHDLGVRHGGEHRLILQHQALAAQDLVLLLAARRLRHVPGTGHGQVPGGDIECSRPHHLTAKQLSALSLQSKEIQKHLQADAVVDIRQVEHLFPRLIVDHPYIELAVVLPAVHPVHRAGDAEPHPVYLQLHRRQILPRAKAQLKGQGAKFRVAQLLGDVVHQPLHRPVQAAEQIGEAGTLILQPPQLFLQIPLHGGPGQGAGGCGVHALVPMLQRVLQHRVDKGAILPRTKVRPSARSCPQTVFHEVRKVAGAVLVQPGGGHGDPPAIESGDPLGG